MSQKRVLEAPVGGPDGRALETLVHSTPAGICACDADGRITLFNQRAAEIWGRRPRLNHEGERYCGSYKAYRLDGAPLTPSETPMAQALRDGFGFRDLELIVERPDGSRSIISINIEAVRDASGRQTGAINLFSDITDRKRAENLVAGQNRTLQLLVSRAPLPEIFAELVRTIETESLNRMVAAIFLVDTENQVLLQGAAQSLPAPCTAALDGLPLRPENGSWTAAVLGGQLVVVEEIEKESGQAGWAQTFLECGFRAAWAMPVRGADDEVLGLMGGCFRESRGPSEWELRAATILCETAAIAIERRRDEERLRLHERQLRLILKNAPTILAHCDRKERFVFVNRAYADRFGKDPEEFAGRPIREVLGEEGFLAIEPYIRRVLAGESVRYEAEVPYSGIGRRSISVAYVPELDEAGQVCGWLAAIDDITEEKRAEQALRESEERFRTLADNIAAFAWMADPKGWIFWYNQRWFQFTGTTLEEMEGWGWCKLHHPDHLQRVVETFQRSIATGKVWEDTFPLRAANGTYRWFLSRALPIHDAEGRIIRWFGTNTDITDLRAAQDQLRRQTDVLGILNRAGIALSAELELATILRVVTDAGRELSGATCGAFLHPESDRGISPAVSADDAAFAAAFGMTRSSLLLEPVFRGEGPLRIADVAAGERSGRSAPEPGLAPIESPVRSCLALPVISHSGEVLGGMFFGHPAPGAFSEEAERNLAGLAAQAAIAIDNAKLYQALQRELNQKRKAEADLQRAQEELRAYASDLEQTVQRRTASLREAVVQMEEFSYSVSHDLRAPLRAMNAYAKALLEDYGPQLDATARGHLDRIHRSSERMEKLTHDILSYSRLSRSDVQLAAVDLDRLLADVIHQYEDLQPPRATVTVCAAGHKVLAHESSLGQCVANLLSNAVKFILPGRHPQVRIYTEERGGRVRLWIQDNGIGIDPRYQRRLFQVFERLHSQEEFEGTGIGLAIVRRAVEKMGGACGVESEGKEGSRFWLELGKSPV